MAVEIPSVAMDSASAVNQEAPDPGILVLELLGELSEAAVPWVYLRNYERLPRDVGNDMDLLVPLGSRSHVAERLCSGARRRGWRPVNLQSFGPLALFLAHPDTAEILHIDIFDRIEWHFLEYADAARILARRRWNGLVYVPDEGDEVVLNSIGRLIYHGVIRARHRDQAVRALSEGVDVAGRFSDHLGRRGRRIARDLAAGGWLPTPCLRLRVATAAVAAFRLRRPGSVARGFARFVSRSIRKVFRRPGWFLVFNGFSSPAGQRMLESLIPWCKTWCAGRTPFCFNGSRWKLIPWGAPHMDLRRDLAIDAHSQGQSLPNPGIQSSVPWMFFLRRLLPLLARSHAIIGLDCAPRPTGAGTGTLAQPGNCPNAPERCRCFAPDLTVTFQHEQPCISVVDARSGTVRHEQIILTDVDDPAVTLLQIKRVVLDVVARSCIGIS